MGIAAKPRWLLGFAGIACLVLIGSAGVAGIPVGAAAAAPRASQAVPHPGSISFLRGLACAAPRSCWAVGFYENSSGADLNQVLHWNGSRWSKASVPSPGGTAKLDASVLNGVGCSAPGSCWAVGDYGNSNGAEVNQTLHWNGTRWSKASVPSPGGTASPNDASYLTGVRCTSLGNCWAVGYYFVGSPGNGTVINQAMHWNGRRWHLVTSPDPAGTAVEASNYLYGVNCASASNCWAVGDYSNGSGPGLDQILHWNGRKWTLAATPQPGGTVTGDDNVLRGVACGAPADCWAVGFYINASDATIAQVLHWGGRKWSVVGTPDPDGTGEGARNRLTGVACASSTDCWAVGSYGFVGGGTGIELNLALHWGGRKWRLADIPDPAGTANADSNALSGVRCTSRANCQAVGYGTTAGDSTQNQALNWNGTKWSTK